MSLEHDDLITFTNPFSVVNVIVTKEGIDSHGICCVNANTIDRSTKGFNKAV